MNQFNRLLTNFCIKAEDQEQVNLIYKFLEDRGAEVPNNIRTPYNNYIGVNNSGVVFTTMGNRLGKILVTLDDIEHFFPLGTVIPKERHVVIVRSKEDKDWMENMYASYVREIDDKAIPHKMELNLKGDFPVPSFLKILSKCTIKEDKDGVITITEKND